MKKLAILCASTLTLGMTSCGSQPAQQTDAKTQEVEETTTESTEITEPETETVETEDNAQYAMLDEGWHNTTLLSEESEYADGFAKKVEFVEGGMLIEASFYRYENDDWDNPILFDMDTYFVPIEENTVYQSSGGDGDPTPIPAEKFPEYLQDCICSGLGLGIEIENGVAKTIEIFS
jgi:hypothetical protein